MTESVSGKNPVEDLTGRSRLRRNLTFAWSGYAVNVVAGFVLPRMISDCLGQVSLGLWDFAWSVVGYFGLVQLGLTGSVDRYVACHRATGDRKALSQSVSTIAVFLRVAGALALVLCVATVIWIIPLFRDRVGEGLSSCRWVVLFLGTEIGVSLMLSVYSGVIAGCHRWDVYHGVSALSYAAATAGMAGVLLAGWGLPALALVHCLAGVGGELVRWRMARRICPELRIHHGEARWSVWLEQVRYSGKSILPNVAEFMSNQLSSILLISFLGPVALAVFSRPKNLARQVQVLAAKLGYILIPTASSLHAQSDHARLRSMFSQATAGTAMFVVPAMLALEIFGDHVIRLWMGVGYVSPGLITVLALGYYASCVQQPVWGILAGMNRHGGMACAKLVGAVASAVLLAAGLGLWHWHLLGAAIALVLPQLMVDALVTPLLACRRLGVSYRQYVAGTLLRPLLYAAPYAACLLMARMLLRNNVWLAAASAALGFTSLIGIYWCQVVPPGLKQRLVGRQFPAWG